MELNISEVSDNMYDQIPENVPIKIIKKDKVRFNSNINEMNEYIHKGYKLNYWKLKSINIQEVLFDKTKWDNMIINKIKEFNIIYMKEKENANPINLFINEDEN